MTDKEIIIDGVDVSKCFKYTKGFEEFDCGENYSKFHYRFCEENPNCYFKQLKRKEQALDKLIPILGNYATSTIGRKQVDGTYKFVCAANKFGDELCLNYDPRPAIEGLNIIKKVKEK